MPDMQNAAPYEPAYDNPSCGGDVAFKEIVAILNVDAPIYYFSPENRSKHLAYCKFMRSQERETLDADNCVRENCDDEVGLYFPDIDVDAFFELEQKRNPPALNNRLMEISYRTPVFRSQMPFVYAVYCVLHEYGHWRHYRDSGKSASEYVEMLRQAKEPFDAIRKEIYDMPDSHPSKALRAELYDREVYLRFPDEKAAHAFALQHIDEALATVRESLGIAEE